MTDKELSKAILKYAKGYAAALFAGEVEAPGTGDCFYCGLRTEEGQTLGDAMEDTAHLLDHIEEGYYVPSLFVNAAEAHPNYVSQFLRATIGGIWRGENEPLPSLHDTMEHQAMWLVRRYLRRKLGLKR